MLTLKCSIYLCLYKQIYLYKYKFVNSCSIFFNMSCDPFAKIENCFQFSPSWHNFIKLRLSCFSSSSWNSCSCFCLYSLDTYVGSHCCCCCCCSSLLQLWWLLLVYLFILFLKYLKCFLIYTNKYAICCFIYSHTHTHTHKRCNLVSNDSI